MKHLYMDIFAKQIVGSKKISVPMVQLTFLSSFLREDRTVLNTVSPN